MWQDHGINSQVTAIDVLGKAKRMEMDKSRCKGQFLFFLGAHKKVTRQQGNIGDVMGGGIVKLECQCH